jgi:kynureninase
MTLNEARALDAADPLRDFRGRFALPPGVIYLDGNSLGPLPRATPERMDQLVRHQWGERLIRSWNEAGWTEAPTRIGDKIARLIGAGPGEVVATDSTSVCLFKLLSAAATLREGAIAAQADGFPTDRYLAETIAAQLGRPFRAVTDPADALGPDIAAAVLTEVDYRLGSRLNMAALSARSAETGTHLVWDLSHSAGAVPLDLHGAGATLAVGCGYKYLNGGPGAPAFLYVARSLQLALPPVIAGWWGHHRPFDFAPEFAPAPGITRFLSGTPSLLALTALETGVDLMLEADPLALRSKGIALWDLLTGELGRRCPTLELRTPRDPATRGSHAIFAHPHALAIVRAAIERGVIGDYRPPGLARFGITPLYLSHEDVWRAAGIIADVVNGGEWRAFRFQSGGAVT